MHLTKDISKKIIIDSGIVSEEDLTAAENESLRSGRSITDILIGRNAISEQILTEILAGFLKIPIIKLENLNLNSDIVELISESYAKSRGVILFDFDGEKRPVL